MRRPAQNVEDIIISSAHRCCRARVVRYCVAAELEEGEATTSWHLVKNPSTSFGTRYEGTKAPSCHIILLSVAKAQRRIVRRKLVNANAQS